MSHFDSERWRYNIERALDERPRDLSEVAVILYDALTECTRILQSFLNSRDFDGYEFKDPDMRAAITADLTAAEELRKRVEGWSHSRQLCELVRKRRERQKIVYLWDPVTMNKYSWPTSSNSGMACVSDLAEKIAIIRRFKKVKAIPVIKLGSRLWSKRYGTPGPDLIVMHWIAKDADGALQAVTEPAAIAAPKLTTTQVLDAFASVKTVDPPTGKEATDDEIKY